MATRDLVFDLDDTLIESFPGYVRLHRRIAADLQWPVPSAAALIEYGPTWHATLARLWPGQDLRRFIQRYEELADTTPYAPVPGAAEALESLHHRGYRLWIVTKRDRLRLEQRMREAKLDVSCFEGIFSNDEVPEPKPSPRCLEPIIHQLGGPMERPLYVGDRQDDHRMAVAAGIEFIAVCTGPEVSTGFPYDVPPSHILPSVADLPEWLGLNWAAHTRD